MENECKGLIFRSYSNVFKRSSGHYEHQQGFRLLKRDSCTGCRNCGGLLDYADEVLCDGVDCIQRDHIEYNSKYRLTADSDGEFAFIRVE